MADRGDRYRSPSLCRSAIEHGNQRRSSQLTIFALTSADTILHVADHDEQQINSGEDALDIGVAQPILAGPRPIQQAFNSVGDLLDAADAQSAGIRLQAMEGTKDVVERRSIIRRQLERQHACLNRPQMIERL